MRHVKHLLVTALAVILALVMAVPAFAAELSTGNKGEDKTITITPPEGVDDEATNTYTVYKVFDADTDGSAISYTTTQSTVPQGFTKDDANNVYLGTATDTATGTAGEIVIKVGGHDKYIVPSAGGELTADQITAIANWGGKAEVGTITITGRTETTVTVPDYGYYYITTSTGTVVTIDSTKKSAVVIDKNTVPSVNKKITGATSVDEDGKKALAQVGTTVNYSAEITIGDGAKGYVFHDTMETGLTYNKDAVVSYDGTTVAAAGHFTLGKEGTDTFTITFEDDYVKTLTVGKKITVTYSAVVNDDAVTVDPLNNTCYVNYGDSNSNNKTPTSQADVYEAKFTVTKNDGGGQPLSGAGFVIKNAAGKYYKLTPAQNATEAVGTEGEDGYVPATPATPATVTWVDSINNATEYTSDAQGAVQAFTGLANGTYTLVEKTVPAGYNKAADSTFTIAEHDYTAANLEQKTTVVNNQGAELPSTGGIGTTIIYIVGGGMVLAGIVMFLTKRRMASVEE